MKDFIEELKKHGYMVSNYIDEVHDELNPLFRQTGKGWCVVKDLTPAICIEDKECESPELMCWCLDEIERLGWWWYLQKNSHPHEGYQVGAAPLRPKDNEDSEFRDTHGKTKTEACCNALLAVLESQEVGR